MPLNNDDAGWTTFCRIKSSSNGKKIDLETFCDPKKRVSLLEWVWMNADVDRKVEAFVTENMMPIFHKSFIQLRFEWYTWIFHLILCHSSYRTFQSDYTVRLIKCDTCLGRTIQNQLEINLVCESKTFKSEPNIIQYILHCHHFLSILHILKCKPFENLARIKCAATGPFNLYKHIWEFVQNYNCQPPHLIK